MSLNFVVRAVKEEDLHAIEEIARLTGPGFNSLPDNREALKTKIALSISSFAGKVEKTKQFFLFVLENLSNQEVIGTSDIETAIGYPWPFYKYKISNMIQVSQSLQKRVEHQALHLVTDHEGATMLGGLFIKPDYRGQGISTLASRARCLFIAEFFDNFSDLIIADMRGISSPEGLSPFWDALGRHFFEMSYDEATYHKSTKGLQFMVELTSHHTIYVDLLPESAQAVIGKTHIKAAPALHSLQKEGLKYRNYIDIFDGGPTVEIPKIGLRTVRKNKKVMVGACVDKLPESPAMLISNTSMDFRATVGKVEINAQGEAVIEAELAKILHVTAKSYIRFCRLRED